ncbi:MAG: hypothetical protein IPM23_01715 [Candidatus Melainabacteria bacterium]|nr:hypothetical protein [Candidatus Melainabacteria bacterium]
MKQKKSGIALTRISWKDVVVYLIVGTISALMSSYLVIEKVSPRFVSQESSQAAQAEAMRDDWRRLYEEAVKERAALKNTVARLNAQIDDLTRAIKQNEKQLSAIQAQAPTYNAIKETIDHASKTDKGLQEETVRILGELGVSRIRILD